jgi:endogenous inhibitor of DNA gyrase (YacG/DUF329 family)
MRVIRQANTNFITNCKTCDSELEIEPSDWEYVRPMKDISGVYDPECFICNCPICGKQIVLEEINSYKFFGIVKKHHNR